MQIIKYILPIGLLLPLLLPAQTVTLTLDSILQRVDNNNLQLQSYALKATSYEHSAEAATAWMAPMVGAGTFMTPYPFQKLMDGRDKGSWMIRAEQDIPNKTILKSRKEYIASKANVELAGRAITLNNLKAQAKQLYYTWLISQQRINVLDKNRQIMEMMKKVEEVRYPYNQSLLGNIYKIDARISENSNKIEMEQGGIQKAKAWLNSLMNQPGNTDFQIDSLYHPEFNPVLPDTSLIAMERKDILQMNENIKSMQLGIRATLAEKKPSFKIQLDHMTGFSSMMPNTFSVMAMVNIPIAPWASKMYKSEEKAMQYNIQAMQTEKAAMLQEVQGLLYGMQYEIQSMQKRIDRLEYKIIPTMQHALDAHFLSYQENKLAITVVIDAWEALNMLQMDVLDEKLKLFQMIADYEKELYK